MISIKMEGYKEALRLFDPRIVDRAARMGLNDTARKVRTESGREIRTEWNVKAPKVNKELQNVKMARGGDLTAIIQAKGRSISLDYFGAEQIRRVKGGALVTAGFMTMRTNKRIRRASGVTVKVRRGKKTILPNAFISTMKNGYTGVFQRAGDGIINKASITIASMFGQRPVQQAAARSVNKHWPTRFNHHLERLHK